MATYTFHFNRNPPTGSTESTTETEVEINEFPYLFVFRAKSFNWAYTGYKFVKWNDAADGSGTSLYYGDEISSSSQLDNIVSKTWYAIWEENFTYYLTTDVELSQVADAIRTKGGTSASLAFPAGFVSAINAIPTGGGSSYTHVATQEYEISTESTNYVTIGTIVIPLDYWEMHDKMFYIKIRDKAGWRDDHYYGSDNFWLNTTTKYYDSNASLHYTQVSGRTAFVLHYYQNASSNRAGYYSGYKSGATMGASYGVWVQAITPDESTAEASNVQIQILTRYNATNSKTIDGTFSIDVYMLDWPDGISPFE